MKPQIKHALMRADLRARKPRDHKPFISKVSGDLSIGSILQAQQHYLLCI
jgi:hypothetical protein